MPSLRDLAQYAVPIGAQVAGGLINRRAAGRASRTMADATNAAQDRISQGSDAARRTMADVYGTNRGILEPFRRTGESALPGLQEGVAEGGEFNTPFNAETFDLYKDPGFNFRLEQGRKAIEAGANAGGIRFSGATLKALAGYNQDMASQEYTNAFNRYQADTQGRFNRMSDVAGIGERAARDEVNAGSDYGANLARLETGTADRLAELDLERANAIASGDVEKSNAISRILEGVVGEVQERGILRSLASAAPKVGGTSLAALAGGSVPAVAGTLGGATPAAFGAGTYGLSALGSTVPAVSASAPIAGGGAAASSGLTGAVTGLLTNPITIAAGAALGVGLLWKKSQKHQTASQWVKGTQDPFDDQMERIDAEAAAGRLTPEQATELRDAAATDYLMAAQAFARKGDKQALVIRQALETFRRWYGDPASYGVTA